MLELRNVKKVYHSKSGNDVTALNDVSVTFPETGMVFILGKSGCGKSTLLNVIGGLDGCDEGEFIIKGKSSKDFAGSDFDAYRNTFIGFIFQEYNILDEFSVGANIALALELQGKKATSEQINAILEQVGMLEYANRKPNELSGGQKQRIAIARALVKDPEIIMADEPTGALDSNTGKQIFDTLKELSKTKLIIIVSHDRDFAEIYGDRIIEMKDGVIISDVTKHHVDAKSVSSGILMMNDNLLKIEKGYQLTAKDVELINEYLRNRETDVIVSGDARLNDNVRNAAGISADNKSAVFKDTDKENDVKVKEYDGHKTKFIRSRLPMKNAVKMGSSSLGHKKVRLVFTIILSLVAFALFGFADTMGSYDKVTAATNSIIDTGVKNASFSLGVREESWSKGKLQDLRFVEASFNNDDISALNKKLGVNFIPVYNGSSNIYQTIELNGNMKSSQFIDSSTAYRAELSGFVNMSEAQLTELGFGITGVFPKNSGEIAISQFMYEQFKANGFKNNTHNEDISASNLTKDESGNANSIIGKHLTMQVGRSEYTYKITAIIDTKFEYDRYADYIPDTNSNSQQGGGNDDAGVMDMVMIKELENTLQYGYHCLGYVIESDITKMSLNMEKWYSQSSYIGTSINEWNANIKKGDNGQYIDRVGKADLISANKITYFDKAKTSLGANEYLIPSEMFMQFLNIEVDLLEKINAAYASHSKFHYDANLCEIIEQIAVYDYLNEKISDPAVLQSCKDEFLIWHGYEPSEDELYITYFNGNTYTGFKAKTEVVGAEFKRISKEIFDIDASSYTFITDTAAYNLFDEPLQNIYVGSDSAIATEYQYKYIIAGLEAYNAAYDPSVSLYTNAAFLEAYILPSYSPDDWANFPDDMKKDICASRYTDALRYDETVSYGTVTPASITSRAMSIMLEASSDSINELTQSLQFVTTKWDENGENETTHSKYKVVGFFDSDEATRNLIISNTIHEDWIKIRDEEGYWYYEYAQHIDGIYSFAIAPMPTSEADIRKMVALGYDESGDIAFLMQNQVTNSLEFFNEFIEMGASIFV